MSVTDFELISKITDIEKIAVTNSIRELSELEKRFGRGRWRKLKEIATVRLSDVQYDLPKSIGMRHPVSAEKE